MDNNVFLKLFAGEKQVFFYPFGTFSQLFPRPLLGLLCFLFPWWQGQDNLLLGPAWSWAPNWQGSAFCLCCRPYLPEVNVIYPGWPLLSLPPCSQCLSCLQSLAAVPLTAVGSQARVGAYCSWVSGFVAGQTSPVSGPCWGCAVACAGPCPASGCRKLVCVQLLFVLPLWPSVKEECLQGPWFLSVFCQPFLQGSSLQENFPSQC